MSSRLMNYATLLCGILPESCTVISFSFPCSSFSKPISGAVLSSLEFKFVGLDSGLLDCFPQPLISNSALNSIPVARPVSKDWANYSCDLAPCIRGLKNATFSQDGERKPTSQRSCTPQLAAREMQSHLPPEYTIERWCILQSRGPQEIQTRKTYLGLDRYPGCCCRSSS